MSADNTIGILITRRRDGNEGKEYRVAHSQCMENIFANMDYPSTTAPALNRERCRAVFKDAKVFFSAEEAYEEATKIEKKYAVVEYGIQLYDLSAIFFPASDRKRNRRRYRRLHQRTAA